MKRLLTKLEITKMLEHKFKAILFGSRAFGVEQNDSDYDYLVDLPTFIAIRQIFTNQLHTVNDSMYYLNSFYASSSEGCLFNIVTHCNQDRIAWITTIEMLRAVPKEIMNNKSMRQLLFETNLAILKKLNHMKS